MERVLVIGATGNIGVSVVIGALNAKREVLAIVRDQASAEKLHHHVGTKAGITTVEADVTTEDGVQNVVDRVKAGKLPDFQHVYVSGMPQETLTWVCSSLPLHSRGFQTPNSYLRS